MYRNTAVSAKSHKKSSKTASPQPYAPFSTILASFSTAMQPLLVIEFQENYRDFTGREGGEKRRQREQR